MSKKLYVLFLHLDAAYLEGIYDSEEKCKSALANVQKQVDFELDEEMYEIFETELNDSVNYVVAEYDDVDFEEDEE